MDDQDGVPAPVKSAGEGSAGGSDSSPLSRWLREMTALAGLIAVVAGSWVSVEGLREKANTDKLTADVQLKSAQEQTRQHEMDLAQQKTIHDADLKNKTDEALNLDARNREQRLAEVIGHLLSQNGSSEGDLAILSQFLKDNRESREIVENAVMARLENPRTRKRLTWGSGFTSRLARRRGVMWRR